MLTNKKKTHTRTI